MKLYRTPERVIVEVASIFYAMPNVNWDELICDPALLEKARAAAAGSPILFDPATALAPIMSQEVWAAGVTYFRSRSARMDESKVAGGDTFYDRVYSADRPELFFKCNGWRVIGPSGNVQIRADATWSVPEPELTLVLNPSGSIVGYTIGNDMSSRDIEGENPLYLPQAKVYDGSCSLGPAVLLAELPIGKNTGIKITITREGQIAFTGQTTLAELKRTPEDLAKCLFSNLSFPHGAYLMTGTGIVPEDSFTLHNGDVISITIDEVGTLMNRVA